jgi:hypothetical protein
MNPLEIALIIIGIVVILISCVLVDKSQKASTHASGRVYSMDGTITEEEKAQLLDKMEELLAEASEEVIIRTDDTLSKISNEKIIAVNEFSDQILEKINRNHEEVVFLYNMLNDKEKDLKLAVKEIDTIKNKVQDIFQSKSKAENAVKPVRDTKAQQTEKITSQASKLEKPLKTIPDSFENGSEAVLSGNLGSNSNSQILALYAHGKSVIEISKLLDLGQGEVKLVIDLFKGKK